MKKLFIIIAMGCILFSCISSSGCIRLVHKETNQDPAPPGSDNPLSSATSSAGSSVLPTGTLTISANARENRVEIADPILPAEYQHDIRNLSGRNVESAQVSLRSSLDSYSPIYKLHFSPQFNATAIRVNVTHGPLVLRFKAVPKIKDPRISYAVVTVRELPSNAVLAEERIDYNPKKDDSDIKDASLNEKQIMIYREGMFHINVYGNQCDIDLSIYSNDVLPSLKTTPAPGITTSQAEQENYDLG